MILLSQPKWVIVFRNLMLLTLLLIPLIRMLIIVFINCPNQGATTSISPKDHTLIQRRNVQVRRYRLLANVESMLMISWFTFRKIEYKIKAKAPKKILSRAHPSRRNYNAHHRSKKSYYIHPRSINTYNPHKNKQNYSL
jgi:hypothetical protein